MNIIESIGNTPLIHLKNMSKLKCAIPEAP